MGSIIRYALLTASRDWLYIGLFIASAAAISLSLFLGSTALVEQHPMSLSYMAGSVRLVMVVGLILFVCFHVRRAFEHKEIDVLLSRPLSRTQFILSYWIGFVLLTVTIMVPVSLVVGILAHIMLTHTPILALLYWATSLLLEISLMVAFSLVAALILRSAVTAVIGSFAFYILSRMMGFFTAIENPLVGRGEGILGHISDLILQAVAIILPRLDLYAKSEWLIYPDTTTGMLDTVWVWQSLIYIPLLLAMAVTDFRRKQF